ncbi:hypothetical protein MTO96_010792 [Rhipicephalus appendiculatus]
MYKVGVDVRMTAERREALLIQPTSGSEKSEQGDQETTAQRESVFGRERGTGSGEGERKQEAIQKGRRKSSAPVSKSKRAAVSGTHAQHRGEVKRGA